MYRFKLTFHKRVCNNVLLLLISTLSINSALAQSSKIFFIDEDEQEIRSIDPGGTNNTVFFKKTEHLRPRALSANATTQEIYFATASPYSIYKIKMDGTNEQSLYTGSSQIHQVDVDETNAKVYWAESNSIQRMNLDGSGRQTVIPSVTNRYFDAVSISGTKMYYVQHDYNTTTYVTTYRIIEANLDGTSPFTIHTENISLGAAAGSFTTSTIREIQVDPTNNEIYWASSGADGIYKKNINGTGSVTTVLNSSSVLNPKGLVLDVPNSKLYWTDTDVSFDNLRSANLNGTGVVTLSSATDPFGADLVVVTQNPVGTQEIEVQGNGVSISDNDATPSTLDNTDFGQVDAANGSKRHYFFIRNLGGGTLNLTGGSTVNISGTNSSDFTIIESATSPVTASSSTHFYIEFNPSAVGTRNAVITINNNDADEGTYNFNITGEGVLLSGETGTNDMRLTTQISGGTLDNEDPSVAYDSANNRFLLVYETEVINSDEEAYGQFIHGTTGALIGTPFAITNNGPSGNTSSDVYDPKVVFNKVANEYFVVYRADRLSGMSGGFNLSEIEVYGQRISPSGTVIGGATTGAVRISQMGPDGNTDYNTGGHNVTYNTTNGEYMVVWNAPSVANDRREIYGQRLNSSGVLIGGLGNEAQLSSISTADIDANLPSITYNMDDNEYFLAYYADAPNNNDNNIYSQRVTNTGVLTGSRLQVTNVATSYDADYPNVIYNKASTEYFVIFKSDFVTEGEMEIYGQRINTNNSLNGSRIQLSFTGTAADGEEAGSYSAIAYNDNTNQILVMFQAEEPGSSANDIYATTLSATNYALLETQSRVSDMGNTNGDATYLAQKPFAAFNNNASKFLIVWEGDDEAPNGADGEDEIYGQFWQAPPTGLIAEINVEGNSEDILDGDVTPSTLDNTDFGSTSTSVVKTFEIYNTGTAVLNISSVVSSGTNASDFVITGAPTTVGAGDDESFTVTFTPSAVGVRNATITINNDDADEAVYDFAIRGTGSAAACDLSSTLPTTPATYTSSSSGLDGSWLCFCDASGNLLLSLDTNGSGAVIPDNGVMLRIGTTPTTSWIDAGGIITNQFGGAIFNRQWDVSPTTQPSTGEVKVKYFFTNAEYLALQDTIGNHNGGATNYPTTVTSVTDLEMFKLTGGTQFGSPHDAGATGNLLLNGSSPTTNTWVYSSHGSTNHSAEFTVTSFSGGGGGIGGGGAPLPIELINFEAILLSNNKIQLNWFTASEINNSHFEIERSYDGSSFSVIGTINGAGTSNQLTEYNLLDESYNKLFKSVFYRIKQVDYNGDYTYSNIRIVNIENVISFNKLKVFPNPTDGILNLTWNGNAEGPKQVVISDLHGKQVLNETILKIEGNNHYTIDVSNIKTGVYLIQTVTNGYTEKLKLVIK